MTDLSDTFFSTLFCRGSHGDVPYSLVESPLLAANVNGLFFYYEVRGVLPPWCASARLHGVIFYKILLFDSVIVNFYYRPTEVMGEDDIVSQVQ
jgi:hypothetical protein